MALCCIVVEILVEYFDTQCPVENPSEFATTYRTTGLYEVVKISDDICRHIGKVPTCSRRTEGSYVRKTNIRRTKSHYDAGSVFRLDALALSVIATATWLAGWLAGSLGGCHTPVLYQNG